MEKVSRKVSRKRKRCEKVKSEKVKSKEVKIEIVIGDITKQGDIEAIVNAANSKLKMGGGVAGAILRAAGYDLQKECDEIIKKVGEIKPGNATITKAYNLPNKYVIHCVGPRYGIDKPESEILSNCYKNALKIAEDKKIKSIAFPSISTGIFGYPIEEAAKIVSKTIKEILPSLRNVEKIRFVLFTQHDYEIYKANFNKS